MWDWECDVMDELEECFERMCRKGETKSFQTVFIYLALLERVWSKLPIATHGFSFQGICSLPRKVKKWTCFSQHAVQGLRTGTTLLNYLMVLASCLYEVTHTLYLLIPYFAHKDKTAKQAGMLLYKWRNTVQSTWKDEIKK